MWRGTSRAFAAAAILISSAALANLPTRAVALSGEPIPGHNPFNTFRTNGQIAINDAGQILFEGRDEADGGLWLAQPNGTLSNLHHFGNPVPGLPGFSLGMADRFYIDWYLNDSGQTTVTAPAAGLGPGDGDHIALIGTAGAMSIAARASAPPPGVGTATDVRALHLNNRGDVVVWFETNHLAQTGTLAAGAPNDLKILAQNWNPIQPTMLDDQGNVAFLAVTPSRVFQIFEGPPANPKLIAESDSDLRAPVLSKNGRIVFSGSIAHGPRSLYVGAPGSAPVAIIHDGDPAPGLPGQTIDAPINANINDAGYVSFEASGGGRHGYWAGLPGAIKPVALDGDAAPADIPGLTFQSLGNQLTFINDSGELLFQGFYRVPNTLQSVPGLWVTDGNGILHLVARQNGQLEFDGQTKTISDLGGRYGLNDAGQIAFVAQFTDGTSGVFLATVPEPTAVILLVPVLILATRRRRRPLST